MKVRGLSINKKLIYSLIIFDLLFIIIHLSTSGLNYFGKIQNFDEYTLLLITEDQSLAEVFQYLKYAFVILLIGYLMYRENQYLYISWLILFLFFILDDSLSLHEGMGELLATRFDLNPMLGLRAVDYGELIFIAFIGIGLILLFVTCFRKGNSLFKKRNIDLLTLLAFMILFGVGFDMIHIIFSENRIVNFALGIMEDGGEMIVMSLILGYVFYLIIPQKEPRITFSDWFSKKRLIN